MILLQNSSVIVAQDYDIDPQTGFLPPTVPISRLPAQWQAWESVLDDLKANRLQLGDKADISASEAAKSEIWRTRVREVHSHQSLC
jgi:indoleamine 2,3-dioxygenase